MVEKDSENFYAKYLRISLPFLVLIFLSFSVFALTTNDANYSGGVYNGGFEYGSGLAIADGTWIGNISYGWYRHGSGSNFLISYLGFDDSKYKSGLNSIKLDFNTMVSGELVLFNQGAYPSSLIPLTNHDSRFGRYLKLKPLTNYKLSFWVDVNKLEWTQLTGTKQPVPTCFLTQYNSTGNRVNNTSIFARTLTTTNGNFVYLEDFGVTESNASIGILSCGIHTAVESGSFNNGNGVVWFDDVRLEEVGSVNLSGQSQGRPSIVVTGVSDNAIDQADTNNSGVGGIRIGDANVDQNRMASGQCFTPTQNKFNGFIFQRVGNGGDFTGDIVVSLRNSNGTIPVGDALISYTIPNAVWNSIPINTDYKVELPYLIDANGTKKYCVDFNSTKYEVNNFANLKYDATTGGSYSGGSVVKYDGTAWTANTPNLYFKTLFEKQSSAFDLNVCSSGDSVCESKTYNISDLNDGETYTISPANAPLFYSGDNNVYFMMHSDSDYNNKTPSMMAKLTYTFDKPTTTILVEGLGSEKTITLTCTPSVLGACDKTYYNLSGTGYQEYTTPLTLTQPNNYTFSYYSTDTGENTETPTTITITVNPLGERIQNILPSMLQLGFLLLLASIIIGLLSNILIKNEYVSLLSVIVGACAIIMIFISILL